MIASAPAGLEELLDEHCADVAALTRRLREVILTARPELSERVYRGWHGLGFHHPAHGYVVAVFPTADAVSVGFEHGADLPDPHGLLRGTGKRLRYLRFTPGGTAPSDQDLVDYLDLAIG